jgi:excisionase family DNA binding protein
MAAARFILMTKSEVAERLQCTPRTVDNLLANGQAPPSVKIGRLRRFPVEGFDEWLRAKTIEQQQAA